MPAPSGRIWQFGAATLLVLAGCNVPHGDEATAATVESGSSAVPGPAPARAPAGRLDFGGELTQGGWIRGHASADIVKVTLDGAELPLAEDGAFFAAFDRDAGAGATLVALTSDGEKIARALAIAPRAWNIEHINAARRPGGATEAFMKLRAPELARINAARAIDTGSGGWLQTFVWPVTGRISGRFGSQRIYRGEPSSYHSGIDITTGASGTPFVAPADGVVILAAQTPFTLEGHLLMLDHGNGLNSAFLHCSQLMVKEGDTVRQGQVIGKIGSSGRATGPHLHWGMKWRDARLDPLLFTGPMK